MGESRLFERDGTWYLHVTATRDIEGGSEVSTEERTPIGVDIGEASLVTVCHRDEHGCPTAPELWADEGKNRPSAPQELLHRHTTLQTRRSERIAESFGEDIWNQRDDVFHRVTREVVNYAESVENSVLVLENLTDIRESIDDGAYMNPRLHRLGFATLHAQIRYKAVEKGIPVETVNPRNTSKEWHACGEGGYRPQQATFNCPTDACWVGEFQADVNGAMTIADRSLSGECRSREHTNGTDSAEDGGRLTAPQDSHADATQQETRGTDAS